MSSKTVPKYNPLNTKKGLYDELINKIDILEDENQKMFKIIDDIKIEIHSIKSHKDVPTDYANIFKPSDSELNVLKTLSDTDSDLYTKYSKLMTENGHIRCISQTLITKNTKANETIKEMHTINNNLSKINIDLQKELSNQKSFTNSLYIHLYSLIQNGFIEHESFVFLYDTYKKLLPVQNDVIEKGILDNNVNWM